MDTSMYKNGTSRRLVILYGSQTGTAQDVAENIAMQSRGSHFCATAQALDSYPTRNLIEEEVVLFICSTTGQGEPPDNMKKFWRFIMRKNLPTDSLENLKFGVLGLGDSSYIKYNFIAKKLDRRLEQLGGNKFVELGLADDQHDWGADATIDPWVTEMWKKLLQIYPLPDKALNPLGGTLPPQRFVIKAYENRCKDIQRDKDHYSRQNPFFATVKSNACVTSTDHFQTTIHVVLDISQAKYSLLYKPGDVVMVKPSNTRRNVKRFLGQFIDFFMSLL